MEQSLIACIQCKMVLFDPEMWKTDRDRYWHIYCPVCCTMQRYHTLSVVSATIKEV